MEESIFKQFPNLDNLRCLVPEEIIIAEIVPRIDEFERLLESARKRIETVKLFKIFPPEIEEGSINLEKFLGQWGNISIEEVCKIALIAKFLKPKKVFEFGTYNGMTTLQLALNTPVGSKIYTLDLPSQLVNKTKFRLNKIDQYLAVKSQYIFSSVEVGSYFKKTKVENKITQLLDDSAEFDFKPYYGQIDLAFV